MELEGLKRGLAALHDNGIEVQDLVTDRHVMIKAYMKRECPNVNHYFDVWHITKGTYTCQFYEQFPRNSSKYGSDNIYIYTVNFYIVTVNIIIFYCIYY